MKQLKAVITLIISTIIFTACKFNYDYSSGEHKQKQIQSYRTQYTYTAIKLLNSTNETEQVTLRSQLEELKQKNLKLFVK